MQNICEHFKIEGTYISAVPFGGGHINDTYLVTTSKNKYTLQKINTNVFKNPGEVMENIVNVTAHLKKKIAANSGDVNRETLTFISADNGKYYYTDENNNAFRMYVFIDDVFAYNTVDNPIHFYNAAKSFGKFQKMLADFDADKLHETIVNFHNTKIRFADFKKAVSDDLASRADTCTADIDFALQREKDTGIVLDLIDKGEIPLRVTHNDTKFNNILIDAKTGEGICVIDLDTIMPGSLLYDFGDALRFGASTAAEDEKDLSKVHFDLHLFEMFAKGFLEEVKDNITQAELELLPFSVKLMTYECGIRFLGDYLNSDIYFKTEYAEHNLVRARTQFKLVAEVEEKLNQMKEIISSIVK